MHSRTRVILPFSLIAFLAVDVPSAAADATRPPPTVSRTPPTDARETWGWTILGFGVAVGASITAYGLTFECAGDEPDARAASFPGTTGESSDRCRRNASVAIWGGIGIMALSTAIGLSLVRIGREHARLVVLPQVAPGTSRASLVLQGSF
jgi:hypothetical protein